MPLQTLETLHSPTIPSLDQPPEEQVKTLPPCSSETVFLVVFLQPAIYNNIGILTMNGTTVEYNGYGNATQQGGGLYLLTNVTTTFTDTTFRGNFASGTGGGIWVASDTVLNLNNCTFDGNIAYASSGGGIYTNGDTSISITGGVFKNNMLFGPYPSTQGAAIYLLSGTMDVNGATFENNIAAFSFGGAIRISIGKRTNIDKNLSTFTFLLCSIYFSSIIITYPFCRKCYYQKLSFLQKLWPLWRLHSQIRRNPHHHQFHF